MVDIQSATAENRRGKKERKKKRIETTAAKCKWPALWAAIKTFDHTGSRIN